MEDPYFDFLKSRFHVSEETYLLLTSLSKRRKLKAGESIVNQGSLTHKVAFLTKGLMRAYITLESGKEITKNIFTPIGFVGAISSIIKNKPSNLCYEALTDSTVFEMDFLEFLKLSKTNIQISNLYNRILEYVFILYENKQIESMAFNATERYMSLKKRVPDIDRLIPQYQIASYLNISPVQLSRIRKSLPAY